MKKEHWIRISIPNIYSISLNSGVSLPICGQTLEDPVSTEQIDIVVVMEPAMGGNSLDVLYWMNWRGGREWQKDETSSNSS